MPCRVHHRSRVVSAVTVQILRPRVVRIPAVRVLCEEPARRRLVEARVHVLQPARHVPHARRERHVVFKVRVPCIVELTSTNLIARKSNSPDYLILHVPTLASAKEIEVPYFSRLQLYLSQIQLPYHLDNRAHQCKPILFACHNKLFLRFLLT